MPISILFVDDDHQMRAMLCEALTGEGYQVQEASDGRQGIKLYENHPTDIVITDLGQSYNPALCGTRSHRRRACAM